MANYNQFKKAWDLMDDTQRKQAVEQNKNNAQFQQFAQQYNNEVNGGSVNVQQVLQENKNKSGLSTQGTNTQGSTTTNQNGTTYNGTNGQKKDYFSPENITDNSEEAKAERKRVIESGAFNNGTDKSVVSQDFDQSRLTNDNAQVSVKEGKASQTGMPDYELNSDARDNEIVNNLNAYINSNPEFFTDRNTFNQSFHYSERNSRQKALLDSFWKGQEDKKTASNYNTGDAIATGMKNSDITPDIMNLIRQNNPEAYAEWQKQMQEEINKRIANFTTPADPYSTAELFKSLVDKLNIEPEDPLQIYDNWYGMCERLGVFKDSDKLANQQAQIEANHKQIENITKKYSSNAGGATSSALSAARLNKALQPYLAIESSLQNEYSLLLQGRNSNLAIANQSANAMVMQANENQRIFNQKLSGLGFAVTTANFRTPEQQAQIQLQTSQISSDLQLFNQSRLNDLARYNTYATKMMENQIAYDLTDLSVDDEETLKRNLNNVLEEYYKNYGAIIQRPKQQVIDDVIAYAKEHGISIAQALKENFIDQLQDKQEYKNMIAKNYANPNATTQNWNYSIDEKGNLKINVNGSGNLNLTDIQKEALLANKKTYSESGMKGAGLRNNNPGNIKDTGFGNVLDTDSKGFAIFMTPEDGFDALVEKIQNIQKGGSKVYSSNMSLYDFFAKYAPETDNNNPKAYAESVAKQLGVSATATVGSVDATKLAAVIAKHDSGYDYTTYGKFRTNSTYSDIIGTTTNDNNNVVSTSNPYGGAIGTTSTGVPINAGGWITALEKTFGSTQRMSDAERKELYESYGINKQQYDQMEYNYAKYLEKTQGVKTLEESLKKAQELLKWNQENRGLHEGWADIETVNNGYYKFGPFQGVTKASEGKALFDVLINNEILNKFMDLKKNNASFGQMSEGEWSLIGGATSKLKRGLTDEAFEASLNDLIDLYEEQLKNLDPNWGKTETEIKKIEQEEYFSGMVNTGINENLTGAVTFIIG